MTEQTSDRLPADVNGDGTVDDEEKRMYLEFKRKELEDQDSMRDSQRKMTWFALFGMLLYPFIILLASVLGFETAASLITDIASLYVLAASGVVVGYFGFNSIREKNS